jgi:hypothetical protein
VNRRKFLSWFGIGAGAVVAAPLVKAATFLDDSVFAPSVGTGLANYDLAASSKLLYTFAYSTNRVINITNYDSPGYEEFAPGIILKELS